MVKNLPASSGDAGDVDSIPGPGRYPGVGNGNPLQYSCLKNPRDRINRFIVEIVKRSELHTRKDLERNKNSIWKCSPRVREGQLFGGRNLGKFYDLSRLCNWSRLDLGGYR